MKRTIIAASFVVLIFTAGAEAQVFVRAPFVRVAVGGGGVSVRAPFVNIFVPRSGPQYYPAPGYYAPGYYGPGYGGSGVVVPRYYGSDYTLPPLDPRIVPGTPIEPTFVPPAPKAVEPAPAVVPPMPEARDVEPLPAKGGVEALTVDDFVKSFKPRAGSYEIDLLNPVTMMPTNVRFTLPEGMLKSVQYKGNTVEFNYGPLRFVRIDFDKDGALVTSR